MTAMLVCIIVSALCAGLSFWGESIKWRILRNWRRQHDALWRAWVCYAISGAIGFGWFIYWAVDTLAQ